MIYPLFIRNFGPLEILMILVVILILFGVGKLPEVGSGLGKGIRNFKKGIRGDSDPEEEKEKKDSSSDKNA